METIINETLGNVASLYSFLRLNAVAEDYFVHGRALIRQLVNLFEFLADVIGIKDGIFSGLPQAIKAVGHDVSQRANMHAEIAIEHPHSPYRFRTVVIKSQGTVRLFNNHRLRQEWLQHFLAGHRA